MSEQLLTIFKFLLLILLYLFFFRVLRIVWTQVREPTPARGAGGGVAPVAPPPAAPKKRRPLTRRPTPTHLVAIQPPSMDGQTFVLTPEMTIGRGDGATITVDDSFVSSVHCRVFGRDDMWMVEDLGSTNGTYVDRKKVTAPTVLRSGDVIQIGDVELEAR